MKAKDLAERYRSNPTIEQLVDLAVEVHKETADLIESRNVKGTRALVAVFREQDDKWRAFSRMCPDVSPEGFRDTAYKLTPDLHLIWPKRT